MLVTIANMPVMGAKNLVAPDAFDGRWAFGYCGLPWVYQS